MPSGWSARAANDRCASPPQGPGLQPEAEGDLPQLRSPFFPDPRPDRTSAVTCIQSSGRAMGPAGDRSQTPPQRPASLGRPNALCRWPVHARGTKHPPRFLVWSCRQSNIFWQRLSALGQKLSAHAVRLSFSARAGGGQHEYVRHEQRRCPRLTEAMRLPA